MKTKEIITIIGFSTLTAAIILIWQDIQDAMLAVITFLIVLCLFLIMFFDGNRR